MSAPFTMKLVAALMLCLALVACKSSEERAEEYFQSALVLIETGDIDRAVVELRNALELDDAHLEARRTIAELFMADDNQSAAYRNYLRLVERFPEDADGRRALAELAFLARNWDEFVRHGEVAARVAPDDPRVQSIALGLRYRNAVQEKDEPAREALLPEIETLIAAQPENDILNNMLLDSLLRSQAYEEALVQLDKMIQLSPEDRAFYEQRLALLNQMGDISEIEDQLREMVDIFPDDLRNKARVVEFYVSRGELENAENFLREISDPSDADPSVFLNLVRFIGETRGPEAARVELERAIAANPNPDRFRAMRAVMDFQEGAQDQAIAELEQIIDGAEASEQTRSIKVMLARMLANQGNEVGARRLVEEVLAEDGLYVDALKMQASWQIQADDTDGAIASLRSTLDAAPEDVQAMNLMAEAYTRAGNHELARDFLALAVDASNNAPAPAIRYARLLIDDERFQSAEDVLLPALRQAPNNGRLLQTLGQLYLRMDDLGRAEQVADTLRRQDSEASMAAANALQAAIVNQREGTASALQYLEDLASNADAALGTRLGLLRARLAVGDLEQATALVDQLVADFPGNEQLRFAQGATRAAAGLFDEAELIYRELVETEKARPNVWLQLSRLMMRKGDAAAAEQAIADGLEASPEDSGLMWAQASMLESRGAIEEAITIYETLYERSSNSVIIANNLASLLGTYREDEESLERAWTIARRLRGADNPSLQDTYGWIAFRRGEVAEAEEYLEAAASGLPRDPIVQFHLGQVYAQQGRTEEALAQYEKVLEIAGPADTREQIVTARAEIERLKNAAQE